MMAKKFRHGDVIVKEIKAIPREAQETKNEVLALGEVTGHKHVVQGATILLMGEKKFLKVEKTAVLMHEEHKQIQLPRGNYEVVIQREYNPIAERKIQD